MLQCRLYIAIRGYQLAEISRQLLLLTETYVKG